MDRNEVKNFCEKIGAESSYISAYDDKSNLIDILFNVLGEKFINSSFYKDNDESLTFKTVLLKKPNKNKNNNDKSKKNCC